jgi:hypothetical protein
MATLIETRLTVAEFWQLPETNRLRELIDGEIVMLGSPSDDHQATVIETTAYLKSLIPDGKIRVAPFDVYFDDLTSRSPIFFGQDVHWVAAN